MLPGKAAAGRLLKHSANNKHFRRPFYRNLATGRTGFWAKEEKRCIYLPFCGIAEQ